jgi:hypothetical protein
MPGEPCGPGLGFQNWTSIPEEVQDQTSVGVEGEAKGILPMWTAQSVDGGLKYGNSWDAWRQGLLIECDDQDLENTVGSWELYGYEDEKRYPKTQSEFFERAAAPLTRKAALLALIFGGMAHDVGIWDWDH